MKKITILTALAIAGLVTSGLVMAQVHQTGAPGHDSTPHHVDISSLVKHLAEVFPTFAAFDANKDGQLDAKEKESLAKAMTDGKVQFPGHVPPNGVQPSREVMLAHIGEMYGRIAKYDANGDGTLDAAEQAAIKTAIEKGEIPLPHGSQADDSKKGQ